MMNKIRLRIAEWICPKDIDYLLLRALSRKEFKVDLEKFKKKYTKTELKKQAKILKENKLLSYFFESIEHGEVNRMAKEVESMKEFGYSRAVIHVVTTIKEKINSFANLSEDKDSESFDKYAVLK
jgi:hypothetical protein